MYGERIVFITENPGKANEVQTIFSYRKGQPRQVISRMEPNRIPSNEEGPIIGGNSAENKVNTPARQRYVDHMGI